MHQFLYDNRWIAWLLFLGALGYATMVYFRAFDRHRQQRDAQRQRRRPRTVRPPAAGGGPAPSTGADSGEGQQEDLLTRLAREEDGAGSIEPGTEAQTTTRSLASTDPAHRSTHILRKGVEDESQPASDLRRAVRAAVEESFQDEGWDQSAGQATAVGDETQASGFMPIEEQERGTTDETGQDSALTRRVAQREAEAAAADTDEAPPAAEAPKQRRRMSETDIMRRAQRHEEIGFHHEIKASEIAERERREVSEAERKKRLSELGLDLDSADASSAAAAAAAAASEGRVSTDQLDDILGQLDAALAEDPPEPASAPPPSAAPAPAPAPAPTARGDLDAPSDDEPTPVDDQAVIGADDEPEAAEPPPPAAAPPASEDIPEWARADTFDDDDDAGGGGEGKQQKLF